MSFLRVTALSLALVCVFGVTSKVYADSKPWIFSWGEDHWQNLDFVPYLENGTHPHNSQWDESEWQPDHWAQQRGGEGMNVIRDLYFADILRGQYVDDDIPVLEVGPGFYMLGGEDKRRVAAMVDQVYGITGSHENAMFMLVDWRSDDPIGSYTQYGLQLQ